MIIAHHHDGHYVLNLAPGEELMSALKHFCAEEGIAAATLTGLGAARQVELAFYDLRKKTYERTLIEEDLEIISLMGNVSQKRDSTDLVIHIHGSFGRRDLSVMGGHVFSSVISGAGEIHLRVLPGQISRAYDEETGLTLMCGVDT